MKRIGIISIVLIIAATGLYLLSFSGSPGDEQTGAVDSENKLQSGDEAGEVTYLQLSGDEYKTLFLDSSQPNTKVIVESPPITSSVAADQVIIEIAQARGYLLQEVPKQVLNSYGGLLLQNKLADNWERLKAAAAEDGIQLNIESAFRSIEDQRELFTGALDQVGVTVSQIVSRQADEQLNNILSFAAPPGYSRHHSGYTIDISDSTSAVFEYSQGYTWISENNYQKAKEYGFIPSYPEGAQNQGPEPEAWEYVWVGRALLVQ